MQTLNTSSSSSSARTHSSDLPITRKRQRSISMDSATSSSSPKRSASEDPTASQDAQSPITRSSPRAQEISLLTLSDPSSNDIDAYMASQGEADVQSIVLSPPPSMTPQTKWATIDEMRKKPMQEGQTWHLVAKSWFRRWQKAVTGEQDKEGGVDERDIGPVDNTSIVDASGQLSSNPTEGVDVEYLPEDAWSLLVTWYGPPIHPLSRRVITRGIAREPTLELFPPRLRVFRLVDASSSLTTTGSTQYVIHSSAATLVKDLLRDLANTVEPASVDEYRVWRVEGADLAGCDYPSGRLIQSGAEVLPSSEKTLADALIESEDAFVVEFMKDGRWIMEVPPAKALNGNGPDFGLPNNVPPPLFSQDTDFFGRMSGSTSTASAGPSSNISSSSKQSVTITVPFNKKPSIDPGTLGLGNMGNTCFMNSALQCLAHTPELADYFLNGVFHDELNPDNPLGMHGAIAESFGALLGRMWSDSSISTSYSPREFKSVLQRFAPQFSGYQQHDSQELVAFLLDGLHEDLNRVLKKPYVEKPDWEGGDEIALIKLARESWEGYMKRNDSVIVDLFQGQYRSTLVCPECHKVSITFDPFMYLTLPLPVQKKWRANIYYVPWDINKSHVKVPVEIGRDASFKDLRQLLGRWMGSNPDNLVTLEIFSHRFYKNLDDSLLCGEMADTDVIVCYELPYHGQQARTYASKKADTDPFIVPVFLADLTSTRYTGFNRNNSPNLFGYPFLIAVTQEDARSVRRMEELVVEQLQRWTTNARDLWTWEAADSDMEEVHIPIGGASVPDAITEIKENGDVVRVEEVPEEGDIVDEKSMMLDSEHDDDPVGHVASSDGQPRRVGPKKGAFNMRLQTNHKEYGANSNGYGANSPRYEAWETREQDMSKEGDDTPVLLVRDDAFYLEFDENMKDYYFGGESSRWEHARFTTWDVYEHPEYVEARRASAAKTENGISLQDCLDEFTKEEQLGEDDLWYCPQCKKHQQATKKFDLWSVPDVLVVHLKRFSNSRALRDKIETFVDFPTKGLDLTSMAQEREIAKQLDAQGVDISQLGLGDLNEPLLYDLFGVDEHLGGLGGGHYRAYAYNHVTDQWYHFDDSYVTRSQPESAVNANAYLLFYRRRTSRPLGGKTHAKVEAARLKATSSGPTDMVLNTPPNVGLQLPTPPNERAPPLPSVAMGERDPPRTLRATPYLFSESWHTPQSGSSSRSTSPPPLDDGDPPSFDDAQFDHVLQSSTLDPLELSSQQYDFPGPGPSSKASPTSSNEVEQDSEDERMRTTRWDINDDRFSTLMGMPADTHDELYLDTPGSLGLSELVSVSDDPEAKVAITVESASVNNPSPEEMRDVFAQISQEASSRSDDSP
ncbi:cysteine proteinase [Artomyces pyxidatus]|uniref:Cysteine proteinase n=1 Tax=Artomyces pyxidatus TaxID=48021 RepID=A0ACB8TAL3_9AGAM|nr:cysteine proteinase [Artomyces pyxidatus]